MHSSKQVTTVFVLSLLFCSFGILPTASNQTNKIDPKLKNNALLLTLYKDTAYISLRNKVLKKFGKAKPGHWGEFVKGVDEDLVTSEKIVALTFDACGGAKGSGYDKDLINYLRKERIHATLFVTGLWIDKNYDTFVKLSKDTLFEIENHGLNHKPCSIDGESEYGIKGTRSVGEAFDEMQGNAEKIKQITGRKPTFYRSATAFIDEACAKMAGVIGITVVGFDVLSGDAVAGQKTEVIAVNVLKNVSPGAIVIMHFNRPKWNTFEAIQKIVPELKKQGYKFSHLDDYPLKPKNPK